MCVCVCVWKVLAYNRPQCSETLYHHAKNPAAERNVTTLHLRVCLCVCVCVCMRVGACVFLSLSLRAAISWQKKVVFLRCISTHINTRRLMLVAVPTSPLLDGRENVTQLSFSHTHTHTHTHTHALALVAVYFLRHPAHEDRIQLRIF